MCIRDRSVGRISTFLDIYIQRDLDNGTLTESQAQELIDHMVMKFRMVKMCIRDSPYAASSWSRQP